MDLSVINQFLSEDLTNAKCLKVFAPNAIQKHTVK